MTDRNPSSDKELRDSPECNGGREHPVELVSTYLSLYRQLRAYANRRLVNLQDAEDATQETAFALHNSDLRFLYLHQAERYDWRVLRNKIADALRRRSRERVRLDGRPSDDQQAFSAELSRHNDPAWPVLVRELRTAVISALVNGLSPSERELLDRRFFQSQTLDQIKREVGMPVSTVCHKISRALVKLHSMLGEYSDLTPALFDIPPLALTGRAHALSQANRIALGRALRELPWTERTAFYWCDLRGRSTAEMAERMAVTPGTVNVYRSRARKRIQADADPGIFRRRRDSTRCDSQPNSHE
jgi:RNA polymerase sigma factor (sigma-70 family)